MGCAGSVSKPVNDAPKPPPEPQLNTETSVSRFNGLKLILSGNGSRKAFGQFMCMEKLPASWNKFLSSGHLLNATDADREHYSKIVIDSIKEEMPNYKDSSNSLGAFTLTMDPTTVLVISLFMFPIFILSEPYQQWKKSDAHYGQEGEEKLQARKAEGTTDLVAHNTYENRIFDRALATVDLREIDKLLESGSWLTSLLVAVENLPVCVSLATADSNRPGFPLIYVNSYFEKITGYNRSEIIGQNCRFLQAGKSEQDSIDRLTEALRNAKPIRIAITNFRKDGMPFKNLLAMKPIMDETGKYRYVVGVQFDVTQDAATPAKLKLAEEVMRMMPNVILSSDSDSIA